MMKIKFLTFLLGLVFVAVGCSSTKISTKELHAKAAKADKDWAEYNQFYAAKSFSVGTVDLERRMYLRAMKDPNLPEWGLRRAAWNLIIAVNEARIPDIKVPPGRTGAYGLAQPSPF